MASTVRSEARYVLPDGSESGSRSDAIGITEQELVTLAGQYSSIIPAGYFVGTARRESGTLGSNGSLLYVTNEHDIDYKDDGSEYHSYGLCQMGVAEAALAYVIPTASNLIQPATNIQVASVTFERNYDKVQSAAFETSENVVADDIWCYLAWAHNAGVGQPVTSIGKYGMDWEALKARPQNDYVTKKLIPYAEFIAAECRRLPLIGDGDLNVHKEENMLLLIAGAAVVGWLIAEAL